MCGYLEDLLCSDCTDLIKITRLRCCGVVDECFIKTGLCQYLCLRVFYFEILSIYNGDAHFLCLPVCSFHCGQIQMHL